MKLTLIELTDTWVISLVLCILMLIFTWLGVVVGNARKKRFEKESSLENSSYSGYLYSLLFFLIAFTFGMSGNRYDSRREVILEETNDISTALYRADLYNEEDRAGFREDFKEYIEARITYFEAGADIQKSLDAYNLSRKIFSRIWERAARVARDPSSANATRPMITALNKMNDITMTRMVSELSKVPSSIFLMLFSMACICAFYSGYLAAMKGRIDWLIELGFCLLISISIFFILDLDRGRRGIFKMDKYNQSIIYLRNEFSE